MQTACWQFCFSDRFTGARNPARLPTTIRSRRIRCAPTWANDGYYISIVTPPLPSVAALSVKTVAGQQTERCDNPTRINRMRSRWCLLPLAVAGSLMVLSADQAPPTSEEQAALIAEAR